MNSGTSFDAGRGCPFICSFCTIINVQGRKSRRRSVSDIEKAARAGTTQVFIGLEAINPDNLKSAQKGQNHATAHHDSMSKSEWEGAYLSAWDAYYSTEHITTIMKRAYAGGTGISKIAFMSWWFYYCVKYEGVHPLEGGYYRKKYRTDRRPGMPIENPFIFYSKRAWENVYKLSKMASLHFIFDKAKKEIFANPTSAQYRDVTITPVAEDETEKLELLASQTS